LLSHDHRVLQRARVDLHLAVAVLDPDEGDLALTRNSRWLTHSG